jgi:acyl-CoA synthetase (AMP-forming)/AMP-acid ligase II
MDTAQCQYETSSTYAGKLLFRSHMPKKGLLTNVDAGVVLFSSGSTGTPKAILLDAQKMLDKYTTGKALRTIVFLMFDHIGGLNTLFYTLSSGGCMILPKRDPHSVGKAIETHKAELLPASPSFLNLMCLENIFDTYDLSSLKMITYGTEPMPPVLLERLNSKIPQVRFKQTYGLSEMGIFATKSEDNQSLWMKLNTEYKIVNGELFVKSDMPMVGYLNAENPFIDGWYPTGDLVEQKDDYIRIIGRKNEWINVGGQKVLPQEIEQHILQIEGVRDVVVKPVDNALLGQVPVAYVDAPKELKSALKEHCRTLEDYKQPIKYVFDNVEIRDRFKKRRI